MSTPFEHQRHVKLYDGYERLPGRPPSTDDTSLAIFALRCASFVDAAFATLEPKLIDKHYNEIDLGYGEYESVHRRKFGAADRYIELTHRDKGSTDAAGPSVSRRKTRLAVIGLEREQSLAFDFEITPAPFFNAAITLVVTGVAVRDADIACMRAFVDETICMGPGL